MLPSYRSRCQAWCWSSCGGTGRAEFWPDLPCALPCQAGDTQVICCAVTELPSSHWATIPPTGNNRPQEHVAKDGKAVVVFGESCRHHIVSERNWPLWEVHFPPLPKNNRNLQADGTLWYCICPLIDRQGLLPMSCLDWSSFWTTTIN